MRGLTGRGIRAARHLRKIESTGLRQWLFGRLFDYGKLEFTGTGKTKDFSPFILGPEPFKKEVERRMEITHNPAPQLASTTQEKVFVVKVETPIRTGERFDFAT